MPVMPAPYRTHTVCSLTDSESLPAKPPLPSASSAPTGEKSAITCATERARQACTYCILCTSRRSLLFPGDNLSKREGVSTTTCLCNQVVRADLCQSEAIHSHNTAGAQTASGAKMEESFVVISARVRSP